MFDWHLYINRTKDRDPRLLLCRAVSSVKEKGVALDLGAGALNDSKYLLDQGFTKVLAVDKTEDRELIESISDNRFVFKKENIENFSFSEEEFDLISSQFTLFFLKKEDLEQVIIKISKALKKDGIFTGQLLGIKDSWASNPKVTVLLKKDIIELLSDFQTIYFFEEENDKKTVESDLKHWHIFHFIVKK